MPPSTSSFCGFDPRGALRQAAAAPIASAASPKVRRVVRCVTHARLTDPRAARKRYPALTNVGLPNVDEAGVRSLESSAKWRVAGRGAWYADARFKRPLHASRDPRAVRALLCASGVALERASVLDVGSGTGRLSAGIRALGARWTGVDAAREMLAAAARDADAGAGTRLVCGDLALLPFADRSFDVVVCCRVLHHLHDERQLELAARELLRVARTAVVLSFWDRASWPALRTRLGWKRAEGPLGRVSRSRASIARAFALAGGRVARYRARPRWLDQQTFALVKKEPPPTKEQRMTKEQGR
ncbi:MAG: class I SAM-dependent methyltransferase [Planctomycetota bacterium]|nr:MAG: class I SAM-dependent methyltransferase [Planctomycetota bacterium]